MPTKSWLKPSGVLMERDMTSEGLDHAKFNSDSRTISNPRGRDEQEGKAKMTPNETNMGDGRYSCARTLCYAESLWR